MSVELLTEHHLEFLNLKGGCTGSSESTLVKVPHYWKSHVVAHYAPNFGKVEGAYCFGLSVCVCVRPCVHYKIY